MVNGVKERVYLRKRNDTAKWLKVVKGAMKNMKRQNRKLVEAQYELPAV